MVPLIGIALFILGAPGILQGLSNMFPPFPALMARRGYKDRPELLPTTEELLNMRIRNVISDGQFLDDMAASGMDNMRASNLLTSAQMYLSALDYITLWRRELMSEPDLDAQLQVLGMHKDQITMLKKVTVYYPTPQDIVHFAVRDVYTPSTISEYGLYDDIPPDFIPAGKKAGLTEEEAKHYWGSHWELPSPTQVYEMLHRRVITPEQASNYLRVADYMPWWRDKLVQISYNPLTRVDIRRMFKLGSLNQRQVYDAYLDLGYNDTNAQLLTDFTVKSAVTAENETPVSVITNGYKAGFISRVEAEGRMAALKYTREAYTMILNNIDDQIKQDLIDTEADSIIDNYTRGLIDINEVRSQLTKLGVEPLQMDRVIQRELAQARKRTKVATKADLDTWYNRGFITDAVYTTKMRAIGYTLDDIKYYLDELAIAYIHTERKKYPYVEPLRMLLKGEITISAFRESLGKLAYDDIAIDDLVAIAERLKG